MASGQRTPLSAREQRTDVGTHSTRTAAAPRTAPLYKRLPHGPHRLERNEVIANQRTRIHGALIEAVARHGYEETSVKQVIALAGVSRRSFYEQFSNKQVCFLATFDLLARRELQQMRRSYAESNGALAERCEGSFERFAAMLDDDHGVSTLVVVEAQRAGVPGVLRLVRAMGACEQMLTQSFSQAPDGVALPMPIVRAIVGGLHGAACAYVRAGSDAPDLDMARELMDWTLQFQTPAAEPMSERMGATLTTRLREIASTYGHGLGGAECASRDERERVLQAVLRLAAREDYRAMSAPQIADEANVPIDAFCELFPGRDECFLAALDAIADDLLAIAADPGLVSDEWPTAVRRVLAELMTYMADHPLHARTLVQEAFFVGPEALERVRDLSYGIATLLTEGAPREAASPLNTDAVAGAIWHTIRCQVAAGRAQLLAALSEHLSYVVLAPYLGAQAAAEVLTRERPPALAATLA
jgi:AcrR family transcriptional regulator